MSMDKQHIRIAIIEFPGTNCERETAQAVRRAHMEPVSVRWNQAALGLAGYDGFIIPGGFSYEDRSRSGIIAALDPLMDELRLQAETGKPVLGICNGAQILVEAGLVPGFEHYRIGAALAPNRQTVRQEGTECPPRIVGTGFYNAWINVAADCQRLPNAFTSELQPGEVLHMPAAHAEGRFVIPQEALELYWRLGLVVFRYCDSTGAIDPSFPVNPNGSIDNIAALCNASGNVMAIMPHPERTVAGDPIFAAMRRYIEEHHNHQPRRLPLLPLPKEWESWSTRSDTDTATSQPSGNQLSTSLLIATVITDNTAVTVERELRRRGIAVSVTRNTEWTLTARPGIDAKRFNEAVDQACASGMLYNANKEHPIEPLDGCVVKVRANEGEDFIGRHTLETLRDIFAIDAFDSIEHAVVWTIRAIDGDREPDPAVMEALYATHILDNPFSQRRSTHA